MIASRGLCERSVVAALQTQSWLLTSLQLKALIADPHPQIDLYVNDSDMSFLKIILEVCVATSDVNLTNATHVLEGTEGRN